SPTLFRPRGQPRGRPRPAPQAEQPQWGQPSPAPQSEQPQWGQPSPAPASDPWGQQSAQPAFGSPGEAGYPGAVGATPQFMPGDGVNWPRSEEHTSELQSRFDLVCRLLLEKKNIWISFTAIILCA